MSRLSLALRCSLLAALAPLVPLAAQRTPVPALRPIAEVPADPDSLIWQGLEWRNIGPANTSGRVADVEGVPGNPAIVYVGSASGGVWKTINGGTTWKPIFDKQPVASIGDIALEPGNPDVIYVGTGEGAPRNSVSFGNGVYKSTDGGVSWRHLGLSSSERITRILVNPRNPRQVIAGVLGHVYGPNAERGVYLSDNGGETWERVLYVDDQHGVSDMDIDPSNPNIVYAAMWRFERKPWTFRSGSEQGGLYKSTDAGRTWRKLTTGLPSLIGRIGVKVAPSNPEVVYVIAESNGGILFRSADRGETFTVTSRDQDLVNRGFYYTQLRVDPKDENRVYAVSSSLHLSIDGARTFRRISTATHVDFHSLWIDPVNPARLWQGQDGGTAVSYDRGETWESIHNIPVAQFYAIYADRRAPFYRVGGGLQDNGSWTGPSRSREPLGIQNDDWRMVSFGDGFQIVAHPDDPDLFLSEGQGGMISRTNMRTREQIDVSPQPRRNDGGPVGDLKYRFNWNSPVIQSPHDGNTVYFAGNAVFRTRDFAATGWEQISPDLTTNDPEKLKNAGGPVWKENTTAEYHGTIISFAESPAQAGVLWAGTDDGNLQLSRDAGLSWTNLTVSGPPVARFSPVSHVEPSRTAAGTAYVAYDRHMFDDYRAHLYKTTDFGRTWSDLSAGLPHGAHLWVVREDPTHAQLLYAGTEIGLFVSVDGGRGWTRRHLKNLPVVAVHDIIVHPVMNDLIIGTHGRALWILDDATPLQSLDAAVRSKAAHLFSARPAWRYSMKETRFMIGNKPFAGPNPAYGALITYYLKERPDSAAVVTLEILDATGAVVREVRRAPRGAGINRINWDLNYNPPRARRDSVGPGEEGFFSGQMRGPQALPGRYTARLTIGTQRLETPVEVRMDPEATTTVADLGRQFDAAMQLREMRSTLHDTLRAVDGYRAQLVARKTLAQTQAPTDRAATLQQLDRDIAETDTVLAQLTIPPGTRAWTEGPRLTERLGAIFSAIDGPSKPPTKAQLDLSAELRVELQQALLRVQQLLARRGVIS